MRRRAIAGAGAAALGAITAVTALLIGSATGYAAPGPSEAYGISADGPIVIEPTPVASSTDGSTVTSTQLELPPNPLVALKAATVTAGDSKASAALLNLALFPGAELPDELDPLIKELEGICEQLPEEESPVPPPDVPIPGFPESPESLRELCDLVLNPPATESFISIDAVNVFCAGTTGNVQVIDLKVLGQEIDIPANPPPNTEIPLDPLVNITFNKQTTNDDGSFSVQGVVIDLGNGEQEIILASATCGKAAEEKPPAPTATKPAPVTTGLPVTG
ncbi:MAG: choice-of-anchor P family protein [Haloechinothrix sp.]